MEIKNLIQRYAYRIEPKPEGGFIARATDPTVPPIEAATREEVQQKIQAKLLSELGEKFPGLNLSALNNKQVKWQVNIDRKPGGGFAVHSEEAGGAATMDPAAHEKLDRFAEELLGFVDKHFPDLTKAMAAQAESETVEVVTTSETRTSLKNSPQLGALQTLFPKQPLQADNGESPSTKLTATGMETPALNNAAFSNVPITPQSSGSGNFFRLLLAALIIAALVYFFVYHR